MIGSLQIGDDVLGAVRQRVDARLREIEPVGCQKRVGSDIERHEDDDGETYGG